MRYLIFAVIAAVGCNHPLGNPDMTGFAPWERLPEGNGITYLETAKAGRGRIPTLIALFKYDSDDALQLAVSEFELEIDDSADKEVAVFKADDSKFVLVAVATVYHYPTEKDGHACRMWVDSDRKQAIIERMWWW